ncbi:MAG TPA: alpha-glucan phosphorylase, partial [Spirochaetota bacterium]|nr:alpha-glucan phosphorylase [Spirochaetota bacterium]
DRGADQLPRQWIARIKESMKTISPQFNTNRMVRDYTEKFYLSAHKNSRKFSDNSHALTKDLAKWKRHVATLWSHTSVSAMASEDQKEITVGSRLRVKAEVHLGTLKPEDVNVELYFGNLNPAGEIVEGAALPMFMSEDQGGGNYFFEGQMLCLKSGQFGFTVRIIPFRKDIQRKFEPGLITWA